MLKKHSINKTKNNINLIIGRNTYTDYNNNLNHNQNTIKDKIKSFNNNKIINSLFGSPLQNQKSLNFISNSPLGLSNHTQTYTQPYIFQSPKLNSTNSTEFSNIKLRNTREILSKLRKTILKIKNKKNNLNTISDDFKNNIITKNNLISNQSKNKPKKSPEYQLNYSKTFTKFELNKNKNKLNLDINEKNKNKYKELRFKVHNTIKSNIHPLCNNFINKAHLFNEKILEYYQSEHYINLIRNYQNKFHYKLNLENYPKINMYTDIKSLEKAFKTNKLDFKKCFSEKEQKLILLDPAYYFQKDNPDNFINVNIAKKKSLADKIQEEDEEQKIKQILNNYLIKKNKQNKQKTRNIEIANAYDSDSKKKLISKVNKILNDNNIKYLNSKKIENLEITNLPAMKNNDDVNDKNDDKYDFFKTYKTYVKESYASAAHLNTIENKKKNKKKKYFSQINNKLRNCIVQLNTISKDKVLQKRAKDNLYYDKAKDEKNKFNIITKQMLIEQNYEYLSKFGRKIVKFNKNENNKNKEKLGFTEEIEKNEENDDDIRNIKNRKESINNDLSDNREKKLINLHINKIKLIYKQKKN